MVVRILSPRIQWIVYISLCPWLLTYGFGKLNCGDYEKTATLQCGGKKRLPFCAIVKCKQKDADMITQGVILNQTCQGGTIPPFGYYTHDYIWTIDCCLIWAKICYQVDREEYGTNGNKTNLEQASTMPIPEDIFNSTGLVDMMEQTEPTVSETETEEYTETKSVMTSTMKPTKSSPTSADIFNKTGQQVGAGEQLELKANKKSETNNAMIGLYAGLPVGLFLFVLVLAVVCYIFRDKLKIMAGKFRKRHKEGLYQESGTTSEQYTGNDISRTFANQEYAMHGEQESHKSENTPTGVYDLCKSWAEPEQNGSFHHNPIQTEAKSSCSKYRPGYEELGIGEPYNAYDRIGEAADRGRFDPTYNHIHGSNVSATDMPLGNKGGSEYDNAFI